MIKSGNEIMSDVYDVLRPYLETVVSGGVYKKERPIDASGEDVVIAVSNASAGQFQEGHAYVNIYVPDIDNGTGSLVENVERTTSLSGLHGVICDLLNSVLFGEYDFSPGKAAMTLDEPDIYQHFVSMDIFFKRITF